MSLGFKRLIDPLNLPLLKTRSH